MQELSIRNATLNDLETLLRFEQGVINAERPFDSTLKTEHTNYYDLKEMIILPHIQIVVAELNGEIIGSGYARIENSKPYLKHQKHAYLGFMYVAPEHRGKGVNQKIIESLKQWSLTQNINELRLEVYQDNHSAIKAYEKIGFAKHLIQMRMGLNDNS
ncbi:MAG TPA: GNAT family N-acetyltransferase [Chitinophagaceae bacterium]|nr:GNAT family N-acetyltransferase [Chitinophagaceae bacterium]